MLSMPHPTGLAEVLRKCCYQIHGFQCEIDASASVYSVLSERSILPYAPAGRHMAPESEGCLYAYGGGACAPMAMGGIPPESQFSWRSGSYLIMSF
jgi:hypothetical protein